MMAVISGYAVRGRWYVPDRGDLGSSLDNQQVSAGFGLNFERLNPAGIEYK